jgi:hypothetical protein
MESLEDEIEALENLDKWRIKSAQMRDEGCSALRHVEPRHWGKKSGMDDALIVKALCDLSIPPPSERVRRLESPNYDDKNPLPVLRAARSMQALAAAPDSAFSEGLLYDYYEIVREIYTADRPDWCIGGACAKAGGTVSAYVTGECVRAILGFSQTLQNTGAFLEEVALFRRRTAELRKRLLPKRWCECERQRLRLSFFANLLPLLDNVALKLNCIGGHAATLCTPADADRFVKEMPNRVTQAISDTVVTFANTIKAIGKRRDSEKVVTNTKTRQKPRSDQPRQLRKLGAKKKAFERSATAHSVALGALRKGLEAAQEAKNIAKALRSLGPGADKALAQIAEKFTSAAKDVDRLIHPARLYLSTVLDRELTAASSEDRPRWDPAEMAFAAASYGFAARSFEDERLRRAGVFLSDELSERGQFRSGRALHVDSRGTSYTVSQAAVLRALAQLLQNVETVTVDDKLAKRVLLFFEDTRKSFPSKSGAYGWVPKENERAAIPVPWDSALAVLALDRITRMLDARINARVFRHFSVKKDVDLKAPPLHELFFPDYGLRHRGSVPRGDRAWLDEEPVAFGLESMRAHVKGLSGREKAPPPLFSLILHGPPGTGKTTFVEALAKTARVPLVEVTPSDIVSSGADVVERRARAVFKALSLLTRVVLLFDEFDPVLKRRDPAERQPTVFSFVTPGMLPKLKTLHGTAAARSVAYVLLTNHIEVLDGAAVRLGRFDRKLGIFPPDPLSREGRLLDEAMRFQEENVKRRPRHRWHKDLGKRVREVVKRTGGAQIEALARKGWFRRPDEISPGSLFAYLDRKSNNIPMVAGPGDEDETKLPAMEDMDPESAKAAERERLQIAWIRLWENQLSMAQTAEELQEALRPPTKVPSLPRQAAGSQPPRPTRRAGGLRNGTEPQG